MLQSGNTLPPSEDSDPPEGSSIFALPNGQVVSITGHVSSFTDSDGQVYTDVEPSPDRLNAHRAAVRAFREDVARRRVVRARPVAATPNRYGERARSSRGRGASPRTAAARRRAGPRSGTDPGDDGGGESSPARRRYSLETYRRILWELSEREAARETPTLDSRASKVRCERLITAMECADVEGRRLTLEEALDAREGGEHGRTSASMFSPIDAQWWGGTAQLVDLLWWSQVPFTEIAEGVITQCPACVRGPLFAVERRADHAELTCGHGCAEPSIRKKLKEVEALAFDHEREREGVSR